MSVGTIIAAVIAGAIVGVLARLALPGRQNISLLMTIVLGILGNVVTAWLLSMTAYRNQSGIAWIPLLIGVAVAALLIVLYSSLTGRRTTGTGTSLR